SGDPGGRHATPRRTHQSVLCFVMFFLACPVVACSAPATTQTVVRRATPTVVMAGGEAVLPHSQIFYHDAPLPTLADFQVGADAWTLAGYDSDGTRSVAMPACCSTDSALPLWFAASSAPLLYAPIIGNGHIYLLAADGYLHVLNQQDGSEAWRVAVGGDLTSNGLALAHGLLYVALDGHYIAALDATTGQERWRFDTGGVVRAAPLVVGHILLVESGPNTLWCLDALTSEKYWVFHSEDALAQFWPSRTPPVIASGLVYVALGAANEFNALNLRTGRKVWESSVPERMTGGPVLDQGLGLVYVLTWSGHLLAYDAHSGALRWKIALPGGSESSPALDEQTHTLYLGSFDGSLYAIDARTGHVQWRLATGSPVTASPLVVQGATQSRVIAATQAGLCIMVDARSGRRLNTWNLGELRAAPVMAQGILYLASLGKQGLFALELQ
ncbi:MAG TPA: PQQ-binding-like beta-propeller repeat protein, partial [Ktedonobacteraceae bacterium]|nr:PQQ-binding-like beta-propeller repeat protein [Ktedonobacteraceae bacterium]